MRKKGRVILLSVFIGMALAFSMAQAQKEKKPAKKPKAVAVKSGDEAVCFGCHPEVQDLKSSGKHAQRVNCALCHPDTSDHMTDSSKKPVTRVDPEACASCHKEQYKSSLAISWKSKAKLEKSVPTGRSPKSDLLLMPHGFTKEHNEPRSHVFMVPDFMIVDRAFGGRFQLKDWTYIDKGGKLWDVIADTGKDLPQTAKAANTVCMTCKTSDIVLKWPYMGDPNPNTALKRAPNPAAIEMAKGIQYPMGCIHCHDPHAAKPRVIRDALIEAVADRGEGTYPYDKEKSKEVTLKKITFKRGGQEFRAIGILSKPDSILMCAQCHVEYNCNPGIDTKTGQMTVMDDRRSNYFPWANVFDVGKKYESINFKDFKHGITGALLTKLQHPDAETQWGSKHERAGVECKDCHMPRIKQKGKEYTLHGVRRPRLVLKETCLRCHPGWTEQEAEYQIDAIQAYTRGKMRKAEFSLGQLVDTYALAKDLGVGEDVLKEAREEHDRANTLWEWWTAENSDGFHNPEQARQSLAESMNASQKGIEILNKAIAQKVTQK
jgi:formate-dependent nitrite reductase cytochrome c552 subunit